MKYKMPYLIFSADSEIVRFCCPGLDKNQIESAALFDDFLLTLSKEKNTFIHIYRLSDIRDLVDESIIISQTNVLSDSYDSFFYLSELKTKSANFGDDIICEAQFMFFDKKVQWKDFLVSYRNTDPIKLIKNGLLAACFYVDDHGADFRFEANISMLGIVQTLVSQLSELDWQINQCRKL